MFNVLHWLLLLEEMLLCFPSNFDRLILLDIHFNSWNWVRTISKVFLNAFSYAAFLSYPYIIYFPLGLTIA